MSSADVDAYIAGYPPDVQRILGKIRETISKAAPAALEKISYRMPCFAMQTHLVYFGAFRSHIGFYPPVRDEALLSEVAPYAGERGNLRFPLDQPIPYALITRIVQARVREVQVAAEARKKKPAR